MVMQSYQTAPEHLSGLVRSMLYQFVGHGVRPHWSPLHSFDSGLTLPGRVVSTRGPPPRAGLLSSRTSSPSVPPCHVARAPPPPFLVEGEPFCVLSWSSRT